MTAPLAESAANANTGSAKRMVMRWNILVNLDSSVNPHNSVALQMQ